MTPGKMTGTQLVGPLTACLIRLRYMLRQHMFVLVRTIRDAKAIVRMKDDAYRSSYY